MGGVTGVGRCAPAAAAAPSQRGGVALRLLLLLALLPGLAAMSRAAPAPVWQIDPAASNVRFSLRVAWLRRLEGAFTHTEGAVSAEAGHGLYTVDVRIDAGALIMHDSGHADWARSAEFFDAERYPWIAFRAEQVPAELLRDGGELTGELMLRGVRRPQTLQIQPSACERPGRDCPLRARAVLRRSEFGMTSRRMLVADWVRLHFSIALQD